jgi:DNA-binding NtrC family response regulator
LNTPPRVLFVDDEEGIRATLPLVLEKGGFRVVPSASVSEALAEMNTSNFDVLLVDLNIARPGDGFLVIAAMRHLQPNCMNFILTGFPAYETALKALRAQVDDYFEKPADVKALISTMRARLSERAARGSSASAAP